MSVRVGDIDYFVDGERSLIILDGLCYRGNGG